MDHNIHRWRYEYKTGLESDQLHTAGADSDSDVDVSLLARAGVIINQFLIFGRIHHLYQLIVTGLGEDIIY